MEYILFFQEIDQTQVAVVGGKGAHLGELSRIEGLRVPAGFCVTTDAFQRIMAEAPSIDDRLDRLSHLKPDDREAIRAISAEIRRSLEGIAIPDDLAAAITRPLVRLGERAAYAVRSSATAEDLPTASFAGQQDTYLNVVGPAAILRDDEVVARAVATKRLAIDASPTGGTQEQAIGPERQEQPALTDAQVVRLAQLGRRIEAHFGRPQDIEWCLVDDDFQIVQSRPITTLFPIPAAGDQENHVYVSVGHQQMMTDPMKPLGLSFWQMTTPRPMAEAGGRLFVDVTQILASPASRAALLDVADVIRRHPEVVAFLEHVDDDGFLDELPRLAGGREARDAIRAWLDRYGMRCVGEIDITRPRWSERPTTLVPIILGNAKNFEPGAGERRFEQGRHEALMKEHELLERLRALPDGERKADEAKRMIDRVRTFIGYREYPKYGMVSRYFVYKQALLEEDERLVRAHVLSDKEDIFYLTFQELHDIVRTDPVDDQLVRQRKDAFRSYQALTPPRVLTSDGEGIAGSYGRDD